MLTGSGAPDPGRLFAGIDFHSTPAVLAAVSGGSDSTALLLLLQRHLESQFPRTRLIAATVDHGLRADSAAEAAAVAEFCAARGIRHVVLRWAGDKPATGLAAAARVARYRLLVAAADAEGAGMILTGHTADDQAETVLMRQARGAGRGLAGMAPATLLDGRVWLMRPLLDIRREALRALLRAEAIGWIDDPSNVNIDYERVRMRAELAATGCFDEVLRTARTAALARNQAGHDAAALIDAHASQLSPGLVRLSPAFAGQERAAAVYALRFLFAVTGGRDHLPEAYRVADLLGLAARPPFRATLSGAVLDARASGIFLRREARGLPNRRPAETGGIWDGRFLLAPMGGGLEIAPLGMKGAALMASDVDGVPGALVRAALAAQPGLWRGGELVGRAPGLPRMAPWAGLLPCFDLAPARAVAALLGAESPPPPPYAGQTAASA